MLYKQKGKLTWWFKFEHAGKIVRKSTGTRDLEAARRRAAEIEAEHRASSPRLSPGQHRVIDLAAIDIVRAQSKGVSEKQVQNLKEHWKTLLDFFGEDRDISTISSADLLAYVLWRRSPRVVEIRVQKTLRKKVLRAKGQSIRRALQALKRTMQDAVSRKWLVELPSPWPKIANDAMNRQQAGKLHPPEILAQIANELSPDAKDSFRFARMTGLRLHELRRVCFAWVKPLAHDHPTIVAQLELPEEAAKGRKAREIPLAAAALSILQRRAAGKNIYEPLFFQGSHRRTLEAACRRVGYPRRVHFRDLRHAFGTAALLRTGDATAVMSVMGHSDYKMMQRYQHSTVERMAAVGAAVVAEVDIPGQAYQSDNGKVSA